MKSFIPDLVGWKTETWNTICSVTRLVDELFEREGTDESLGTVGEVGRGVADQVGAQRPIDTVGEGLSDQSDGLRSEIRLRLRRVVDVTLVILCEDAWAESSNDREKFEHDADDLRDV